MRGGAPCTGVGICKYVSRAKNTEKTVRSSSSLVLACSHVGGAMDANITLWQFLLELLLSKEHEDIIAWTNQEGEFKLINAEEVARLWGLKKNKSNMNYDKLSRALRYYYDKNIIKKVMGQKFVYRSHQFTLASLITHSHVAEFLMHPSF